MMSMTKGIRTLLHVENDRCPVVLHLLHIIYIIVVCECLQVCLYDLGSSMLSESCIRNFRYCSGHHRSAKAALPALLKRPPV